MKVLRKAIIVRNFKDIAHTKAERNIFEAFIVQVQFCFLQYFYGCTEISLQNI